MNVPSLVTPPARDSFRLLLTMQVSFSPEQMAPLHKKCSPFPFSGGASRGVGTDGSEAAAGLFDADERSFSQASFIFVLWPVTAAGNGAVS